MKKEIEPSDYCYWENLLHENIERLYEAKNNILDTYINLVKICREHGQYKIDIPYEYCAYCTCNFIYSDNNVIYRIVGIDMSNESTIDPNLILQDKELCNATDEDRMTVNIKDTDLTQARLSQIIIDYIENWQEK